MSSPIRSQREILEERYAQQARRLTKEQKERRAEIARINALPKPARKKERKDKYRSIYETCKMKRELITEQYPFRCKEAYYAKYAYKSAVDVIMNHPGVPAQQKQQTARWHQLPYYTRDAYVDLIKRTFALRDDLKTKERKLWAGVRHIV